ncbi:hypothetical protein M422DRAFT_262648 [Sphaerobolus stellatus SS14]|uniref:Uncharacterized protein n=1 Tax=Sphaerobolus stellatus (strain SS14) TaxID=990650 RepID=A0A0C9UJN0_SPHS4|nr:hypothetical protein M422DRAFT_262648 [Sphaerobolus stellatus SS14]
MLLQAEYNILADLFNSVPSTFPEQPHGSKLPPHINSEFAEQEGAWPAFNKAMHAAFGDKSKGLKIGEHGAGLTETLRVIRWCLETLESTGDHASVDLVGLWVTSLIDAAKAHNCQLLKLSFDVTPNPTVTSNVCKKQYIYFNEDGEEVEGETLQPNPAPSEPSSDEEYVGSSSDSSDSEEEIMAIENEEVSAILPRKTEPERKNSWKRAAAAAAAANEAIEEDKSKKRKHKNKNKNNTKKKQGIETEPAPKKLRKESTTPSVSSDKPANPTDPALGLKKSPIYHFYEQVPNSAHGLPGKL